MTQGTTTPNPKWSARDEAEFQRMHERRTAFHEINRENVKAALREALWPVVFERLSDAEITNFIHHAGIICDALAPFDSGARAAEIAEG
jgi:hypothetical protein